MPLTDYLLLVPLDEEWKKIWNVLSPIGKAIKPSKKNNSMSYYAWNYPTLQDPGSNINEDGNYLIAGAAMSRKTPGQAYAASFTMQALDAWHPSRIVMMGIAGSLEPKRLLLGDVVVSDKIFGYEVGDAERTLKFRRTVNQSGALDLDRVRAFLGHDELYTAWQKQCLLAAKKLPKLAQKYVHPPTLHIENTASGNYVVKSKKFAENLKKQLDWSIAAVEMEATGLFQALHLKAGLSNALMIRGISDYADGKKEKLDKKSHNSVRAWASGNAARLLKALWQTVPFIPISSRYKFDMHKGHPSRMRQANIPDIEYKQLKSQSLSFPNLLHRRDATPALLLQVIPKVKRGITPPGKGLCIIDGDPSQVIMGTDLKDGGLYFSLPANEHGLHVELLLSYQSRVNQFDLVCEDDFGRRITESLP
ncbi:MAG TPA: hypothetical protein VNS58_09180 [Puia sp.]|nr:hypothetical protein [Puia sp.]